MALLTWVAQDCLPPGTAGMPLSAATGSYLRPCALTCSAAGVPILKSWPDHRGRRLMDRYPLDHPPVKATAACSGVQLRASIMPATMSATTSLAEFTVPSVVMVNVATASPPAPATENSGGSWWPAMAGVLSRGSGSRGAAR